MSGLNEIKKARKERKLLVRKIFLRYWPARLAFYFLVCLCFVAIFAPFIANHQPLYVNYKGKTYYPAWQTSWVGQTFFGCAKVDTLNTPNGKEVIQFDITDWRKMQTAYVIWPLVPFSPENPDYYNRDYVAPSDKQLVPLPNGATAQAKGKFRHVLGTDDLGRDVLAGIIHGTRTSLAIGFFAMLIATFIGLMVGVLSGYFGDDRFELTWPARLVFFPAFIIGCFYGFIARSAIIAEGFENGLGYGFMQFFASVFIFITIPALIVYLVNLIPAGKKTRLPIDSLFSRSTEVFNSLPKLLLIISLSVLFEQHTIWLTILIIGCTSWTEIARLSRAELLRIRELGYIEAARSSGMSNRRIMLRHALPNALSPVYVSITFGIASAILIESGLSFLGIGVPEEAVTWGSMLSHGKQEMEAWWLVIYPGLALFLTVFAFNRVGEGLRDSLDPRLKHRK